MKRRPVTGSGAAASPRPATIGHGAFWWSAPGATAIPPRVGKKKLAKVEAAPPAVQEIAWKAQARLTARYRALARRGKRPTLVVTAIARELSGFIWAVSRAVGQPATPAK